MSVTWKVAVVLAVVLAIKLQASEARHSSNKDRSLEDESNGSVLIHGKITCDGVPLHGGRPFITSEEYPDMTLSICATGTNGWYRLNLVDGLVFRRKVTFTLRHQCPVDGVIPMSGCKIPYYTTEHYFDATNYTYITKDMELSQMKLTTRADCL